VLSVPQVAIAEERQVSRADNITLDYQAPPECGSHNEVIEKFVELGGSASGMTARVVAKIVVSPQPSHYALLYQSSIGDTRSERRLELLDCRAVVEASALLLLISLDPNLAGVPIEGEVSDTGDSQDVPESGMPEDRPGTPTPRTPEVQPREGSPTKSKLVVSERSNSSASASGQAWSGFVAASVDAGVGLSPSPLLGGGVAFGARLGWLWFGARGSAGTSLGDVAASRESSIRLATFHVRVHGRVGASWTLGPVRAGPYLGAGVDLLSIRAQGLARGGSGQSPLLSGAIGASVLWRLDPRWAFELDGGLTWAFERPAFSVIGLQEPVYRPNSLGGHLAIGINWSFGSQ
jgi:hypothetical protein